MKRKTSKETKILLFEFVFLDSNPDSHTYKCNNNEIIFWNMFNDCQPKERHANHLRQLMWMRFSWFFPLTNVLNTWMLDAYVRDQRHLSETIYHLCKINKALPIGDSEYALFFFSFLLSSNLYSSQLNFFYVVHLRVSYSQFWNAAYLLSRAKKGEKKKQKVW